MTQNQQPAARRSLYDITGNISDANTLLITQIELNGLRDELENLREKLKFYEDLGDAGSDVQLLRTGYAAARLEIESLRARSVASAGEYPLPGRTTDELMESQRESAIAAYRAAHGHDPDFGFAPDRSWIEGAAYVDADRAMRAAQPAGAQQPGAAYAAQDSEHQMAIMQGERNASLDAYSRVVYLTGAESRLYEAGFTNGWRRRDRLASHGQAPAQAAPAAVAIPSFEDFCKRHGLDPKKMDGHGGMWARVALDECRATAQPAPQADSQPAPVREHDLQDVRCECCGYMTYHREHMGCIRATRAPADSVTAPAGAGVAHALSDGQIEAMPVWRNFVGLWPESRREIVDAVVDLLTTPPTQAADSVLEDAARLEFEMQHGSAIAAARKQGANHD